MLLSFYKSLTEHLEHLVSNYTLLLYVSLLPQSSTCSTDPKTFLFIEEGLQVNVYAHLVVSVTPTESEKAPTCYNDVVSEDNTVVSVVHWKLHGKILVNKFT